MEETENVKWCVFEVLQYIKETAKMHMIPYTAKLYITIYQRFARSLHQHSYFVYARAANALASLYVNAGDSKEPLLLADAPISTKIINEIEQ